MNTLRQAPLAIPGGRFAALARAPQGADLGLVGSRRT